MRAGFEVFLSFGLVFQSRELLDWSVSYFTDVRMFFLFQQALAVSESRFESSIS